MMVILKSAEENLIRELKTRAQTDPSCRCLYWRASSLGDRRDEILPFFLKRLEDVLLSDPGQAYICHDGDVFIIARTLTGKILDSLQAYLSHKLGPALPQGLADLFEIGIDAERLLTISARKLEAKKALARKQKEREKELIGPASMEKALHEISGDLIATIAMRRQERELPEIMIVEDDAFSQKLVSNALGTKYKISACGDGQGAIMSYVTKAPDVLFLDIGLPDMDGHAVLERIFKLDPEAYVVMFSGNGNKENIMRAVELGAKGFVGKPFTKEKLFQYIEKSPHIQVKQEKEKSYGRSIA